MSQSATPPGRHAVINGEKPPGGLVPPEARIRAGDPPRRYTGKNITPVHSLHYDWTGWPTAGTHFPASILSSVTSCAAAWREEGLLLLHSHAAPNIIQLLFSALPSVHPVFCCMRAKGRLQHALRQAGTPVIFSRKVSFRCLGENTSKIVAGYLQRQVGKEDLADRRYAEILQQFTVTCPEVRLATACETASGRYWYNLHVVLVVANRFRITNPGKLGQVRDAAFDAARWMGCRIAKIAVLPDHVHISVRGNIEWSPSGIGMAFQNALAQALGCRVWQDEFYVGTFSEYGLDVVRAIAAKS